MPIDDLLNQGRVSPFTEEDRIDHTTKLVERQFGVSVDQLGVVEMRNERAVLVFTHNDQEHTLTWRRGASGPILWYLDDRERPIALGEQSRALERLRAQLS